MEKTHSGMLRPATGRTFPTTRREGRAERFTFQGLCSAASVRQRLPFSKEQREASFQRNNERAKAGAILAGTTSRAFAFSVAADGIWCSGVKGLEFLTLPSQRRLMGLLGFNNDPVQRVRLCDGGGGVHPGLGRQMWEEPKARNSPCANQLDCPERERVQAPCSCR